MVDMSKLDPYLRKFLDTVNALSAQQLAELSVEDGRKAFLMFALTHAGSPLRMARVEDVLIPNTDVSCPIPLRIYTPQLHKQLPALIYFHGGGWQRGDIATHDSICRHLSRESGCIVVSVEWRLAPEYPFPIGLQDALLAYAWIVKNGERYNIDTLRLGIGGDSAGGNIAAVTTHRLRTMKIEKPIFQLLLYPSLDLSCSTQSYIDYGDQFFLTTERARYYISTYLSSQNELNNPMASPLKQSHLENVPRTHIVTAGFDPLRDDGEIYYHRLKDAGIPVTHKCYESMIHAFLHMNYSVPTAAGALRDIGMYVRDGLRAGD